MNVRDKIYDKLIFRHAHIFLILRGLIHKQGLFTQEMHMTTVHTFARPHEMLR